MIHRYFFYKKRTQHQLSSFIINLVGPKGVEPSTSPLSGVRSNQLSYGPIQHC